MNTILTLMTALMMRTANASQFSMNVPGSYYEVTSMQHDVASNKTYSVWSRYDVISAYNTHADHFHVEITEGNPTVAQLVALAQSRSDAGIVAVSPIQ